MIIIEERCPFCNESNIERLKLAESKHSLLIANLHPANNCHLLVIPKKHVTSAAELNDRQWEDIGVLVQKTINRLCDHKKYTEIHCFFNKGEIAGQTLDHFHIHIVLQNSNTFSSTETKDGFKSIVLPPELVIPIMENISFKKEEPFPEDFGASRVNGITQFAMKHRKSFKKVSHFEKDDWLSLWDFLGRSVSVSNFTIKNDGYNVFFTQKNEISDSDPLIIRTVFRTEGDGIQNASRTKCCRTEQVTEKEIEKFRNIFN